MAFWRARFYHELRSRPLLRERARRAWCQATGTPVNVYDGNRFYKIGPWNEVTAREVAAAVTGAGFEAAPLALRVFEDPSGQTHRFEVLVARKGE